MKTGLKFYDRKVIQKPEMNLTIVMQKASIKIDEVESLKNAFILIPNLWEHITDSQLDNYACELRKDGYYIVFNSVGIAKCSPEDVFDEKIGFRLAETRAQKDAFDKASTFYTKILSFIEKMFYDDIVTKCVNCQDSYYGCGDHIEDIIEKNYKVIVA